MKLEIKYIVLYLFYTASVLYIIKKVFLTDVSLQTHYTFVLVSLIQKMT